MRYHIYWIAASCVDAKLAGASLRVPPASWLTLAQTQLRGRWPGRVLAASVAAEMLSESGSCGLVSAAPVGLMAPFPPRRAALLVGIRASGALHRAADAEGGGGGCWASYCWRIGAALAPTCCQTGQKVDDIVTQASHTQ